MVSFTLYCHDCSLTQKIELLVGLLELTLQPVVLFACDQSGLDPLSAGKNEAWLMHVLVGHCFAWQFRVLCGLGYCFHTWGSNNFEAGGHPFGAEG
jgi:hypothetical protein